MSNKHVVVVNPGCLVIAVPSLLHERNLVCSWSHVWRALTYESVSYTHLDVYKRQVVSSVYIVCEYSNTVCMCKYKYFPT